MAKKNRKQRTGTIPNEILNLLTDGVTELVKATMIKNGVKANSDLVGSVEVRVLSTNAIDIIANDYYTFVSTGRRPNVRKVPIQALIKWIKKNGLTPKPNQTINGLAFAIQTSIFKNGIKGKKYIDEVNRTALDFLAEEYSNLLEEFISNDLQTAFTNK